MTSRSEARALLSSVEEARSKTREALNPSYFDLASLLVAQSAAVLISLGHTTDAGSEIVVPLLIAAGLGICGVMTMRTGSRLGARLGVARVAVPVALLVADIVVNFTVHGQGELAGRAIALGLAGVLLGAFTRNLTTPSFTGVFAIIGGADALDWNPGLAFGLLALYLGALVLIGRKQIFGKS